MSRSKAHEPCSRCKLNPRVPKVSGGSYCRECLRERGRERLRNNREMELAKSKRYDLALRKRVIDAYGGKCACPPCGEMEFWFLCLDHVNNDGSAHRKEVGKGLAVYRWARNNGYPASLQVLCHNCNMAKQYAGKCPHQTNHQTQIPTTDVSTMADWTPGTCKHGYEKVPMNSHRTAFGIDICEAPSELPPHRLSGPLAWQ